MAFYEINPNTSSSQIQAYFDKSNPTIVFTPGVYNITTQIKVKSNTRVIMYGATLKRSGVIQSIFISYATGSTVGYNGAENISFEGGTVEGIGSYSGDNLITMFHARNIKFYNMTFLDAIDTHHLELNACKDVLVLGCRFLGYKTKNSSSSFREAIQIDFAAFSELVIAGTSTTSACYDLTCCENITIQNCVFDKSPTRPSCNIAIGSHSQPRNTEKYHKHIKILHNVIYSGQDYNKYGIQMSAMRDVIIDGNTFYGFARAIRISPLADSYTSKGVKVAANEGDGIVKDVIIKNNTFKEPIGTLRAFGVYTYSYTSDIENVIVENNIFEKGSTNPNAAFCVYLEHVSKGIVANNICGDSTVKILESCTDVTACKNI